MASVQELLTRSSITVSAPCRVDAGGTWDIKALALPLERIKPATVNMALNLRTTVTLTPYDHGKIKIRSKGFSHEETASTDRLPFDSPFGIFFAAASHFGFHGMEIGIDSDSPVKSALGGSSTALVALLAAFSELEALRSNRTLSRKAILHLAYHLEDGVSGGNCGIQDQAAAVYGGVHYWQWHFSRPAKPFTGTRLLDRKGCQALSKRLLVAYSGRSHVAAHTNRKWVNDFLSGKTRFAWIKANESVHGFAKAIREKDWDLAARFLREETAVRKKITPEAFDQLTEELVEEAENAGCGGRFAGAGAGGSLWALGKRSNIDRLREKWGKRLAPVENAQILDAIIDSHGICVERAVRQ